MLRRMLELVEERSTCIAPGSLGDSWNGLKMRLGLKYSIEALTLLVEEDKVLRQLDRWLRSAIPLGEESNAVGAAN